MKHLLSGLLLLGIALALPAQEVSDEYGLHVVVAGDTLRGITRQYLGSEIVWRDNWTLNPHIRNPDLLRIGDRLKIITSRTISAERASVAETVREVDKTIQNGPWTDALVGDLLIARDGIRTLKDSSATLRYNDETNIRLDEFSQVFLTNRERDLRGIDRGTIEVIQGGAALVWEPLNQHHPRTDIKVVSGDAETDLVGSWGTVSLHAGRGEDEATRLSMYSGRGEVNAGGESVTLKEGLGVAVPDGGVPGDPEKLLRRPSLTSPGIDSEFDYDNPLLRWSSLDEAAGYRVEVCEDSACERVRFQADVGAGTLELPASSLGKGRRYWRAAGVSSSGLLGYFSRPVPFIITRDWTDLLAPGVVVEVQAPAPVAGEQGLYASAASELTFHTQDDASDNVVVYLRWNDEDFRAWDGNGLPLPENNARLEFYAVDLLGHRSPTHELTLRHDRP